MGKYRGPGGKRIQSWGKVVSSTVGLILRDLDHLEILVKKSSTFSPFCRVFHDVIWVPDPLAIGVSSSIKQPIKCNYKYV